MVRFPLVFLQLNVFSLSFGHPRLLGICVSEFFIFLDHTYKKILLVFYLSFLENSLLLLLVKQQKWTSSSVKVRRGPGAVGGSLVLRELVPGQGRRLVGVGGAVEGSLVLQELVPGHWGMDWCGTLSAFLREASSVSASVRWCVSQSPCGT